MKTIEERVEEIAKNKFPESVVRAHRCEVALHELAADLQAEKEKEVAELKEKLATLAKDYSEVVAGESEMEELTRLRAWKESALKVMPDFQKLGKLLGLPLGSGVSEQLVPAVEKLTKEVAELREKLAAIEAGSDVQNLSVSSHFELDCGPIKVEPALLDEVKRVLGMAKNSALSWDMLGRAQGNIAVQIWREDALKLLTRLGGSHE